MKAQEHSLRRHACVHRNILWSLQWGYFNLLTRNLRASIGNLGDVLLQFQSVEMMCLEEVLHCESKIIWVPLFGFHVPKAQCNCWESDLGHQHRIDVSQSSCTKFLTVNFRQRIPLKTGLNNVSYCSLLDWHLYGSWMSKTNPLYTVVCVSLQCQFILYVLSILTMDWVCR